MLTLWVPWAHHTLVHKCVRVSTVGILLAKLACTIVYHQASSHGCVLNNAAGWF